MAEVIKMPRMSDTMTEGTIIAWHKKVGDKIKPGDVVAEIETDKAVMEFESFQEGTILYIGPGKGAAVPVDSVIAVIGKDGEDYKAALEAANAAAPAPAAKEEAKPAPQATPTASAPPPPPPPPQPKTAPPPPPPAPAARPVIAQTVSVSTNGSSGSRLKASPLAKKIAKDSGIDITKVKGSGDEGRVVRKDVESFLSGKPAAVPALPYNENGYYDAVNSQMRKTIARRLAESKFSAPHFYLTMEIKMDNALSIRKQLNEISDVKTSVNDFVIKAVALALKKNPKVNCSWLGDYIRYYDYVNIGMAVSVEDGLLVPVIRSADQKSIPEIATESKYLAARARDRKLQPNEWEGNTFSISNLGMMDIDEFTAIINPPDACILAIGKAKEVAVFENGVPKPVSVMKVTLSCDHRAVDGALGAAFLQTFKAYMENPVALLIG
jgi:pyruvate dehydrogenase E2 component (dihydrolipoamide acetyltransferase)